MNFAPNIETFLTGTYTVTRRGPATIGADGYTDIAAASTFPIRAAVQPLNGRDLERLPQGDRVDDRKKLYTSTALRVSGSPDVVTIGAESWEVEALMDWSQGGYYRYAIRKVGS